MQVSIKSRCFLMETRCVKGAWKSVLVQKPPWIWRSAIGRNHGEHLITFPTFKRERSNLHMINRNIKPTYIIFFKTRFSQWPFSKYLEPTEVSFFKNMSTCFLDPLESTRASLRIFLNFARIRHSYAAKHFRQRISELVKLTQRMLILYVPLWAFYRLHPCTTQSVMIWGFFFFGGKVRGRIKKPCSPLVKWLQVEVLSFLSVMWHWYVIGNVELIIKAYNSCIIVALRTNTLQRWLIWIGHEYLFWLQ